MKGGRALQKQEQGSKTKEAEHLISRCENFAHPIQGAKSSIEGVPFSHTQFQGAKFADQGAKISHEAQRTPRAPAVKLWNPEQSLPPFRPWRRPEEAIPPPHPHRHLDHIEPPWEPQLRHLFRPRPFPHLRGSPFSAPIPTRRPPTDPVPPAIRPRACFSATMKRTKFSGPGEPSHAPQPEPPTGTPDSCGYSLETVIRRPMIAGPPIEGNLDCRDRSFHSETYFDIEALRQQPELRDSFRLLQRGTSTASVLTRRELPSGMLLIDKSPSEEASEGRWHPITISEAPLPDFRAWAILNSPVLRGAAIAERILSRQMASLGSLLCTRGSPAVPAPPELPRDEQLPQPAG
ncbi:hypothetical protein CK203_059366 [Vitis vinifera]|uniref:Uncharacterized protein n=1 Tax=Vitis vinifera TaxID=29760 RepID=A0A438GBK5_VITVI|nr:hypothetical protein CK203_059366 [Vitis vinifera]